MPRPSHLLGTPLLLTLALQAQGPTATPPPALPSCCAEAAAGPLPPLPETATAKERWLRRIHEEAPKDARNVFLSNLALEQFHAQWQAQPADAPLVQRFGIRWTLAQAMLRTGDLDAAVGLCRQCVQLCDDNPGPGAAWLPEVLFRLAAIHFRQAEKDNCIARHNADSCILPLSPRAVHLDKAGATAAREVLERLLALPQSDPAVEGNLQKEAIWLLNIAHMAIGDWPLGVPEAFRIPASVFASEAPFPRMIERSAELGLAHHNHAGSIAIDDFTGDGRLDILCCSFDTGRPPRLSRNDGDGRFTIVTEPAGLQYQLGGGNVVTGDVDNDGRIDLLILRGGGFFASCEHPASLLRQDAPGHFEDITAAAGIEIAAPTRSACFADVDRDGDLDLFVGYESERTESGVRFPAKLFTNDGKGHFVDATKQSGIENPDRCVGAVFGDIDDDGDPDLYVSNFLAGNRLFVNQGDGRFLEQATARGVAEPLASGPCGFFDYDNDGDLDLFVTYQHHYRQIRTVASWYIDRRIEDDTQRLFENDGKGHFRDVTADRGLRRVSVATGLNFGDLDDDGRPDLYVTTGAHDLAALFPNVLLLGGERFADATFAAGVGHLQKGNGVAFADLDDDGDLDLGAQVGGFYPDDAFGNVLFENPGTGNHWLGVELHGTTDNRFGVGARVRARIATKEGETDVFTTVGVGGSLGCNPLRAHLGLGQAERIVFVEVRWPASGVVQRLENVPMNAAIRVHQDQPQATRVDRSRLQLGGAR